MNSENYTCLNESTDSLRVLNSSDIKVIENSLVENIDGIQSGQIENNSDCVKISQSNEEKCSKNSRVKFKNVIQFKKDVVIKKLLKTIDVMNQELSKIFRLIEFLKT